MSNPEATSVLYSVRETSGRKEKSDYNPMIWERRTRICCKINSSAQGHDDGVDGGRGFIGGWWFVLLAHAVPNLIASPAFQF